MRVAFLDPLEARLADFPKTYLAKHGVLLTTEAGRLPDGLETAEAVVWWDYPVDAALIESLPRLRFMQRIGMTRFKGDASAALAKGIPVSAFPLGVPDRVAFHAFALTAAVLRKLLPGHRAVVEGLNPDGLPEVETGAGAQVNWARIPEVDTLNDKTVGIAGFGEIGSCYARMLGPFNCRVLYHKRNRLTPAQEAYFGVEYASLDDLLSRSDVITSFVPYTEESRKMLGRREFELMKPSAIFINCGRGNTVDEQVLIDVLTTKRIAGAGVDVFAIEPVPHDNPLLKLDNVILTPHSAGGTPGWVSSFERIAEQLRRVEAGEPIMLPMTPDMPEPF